MLRKPPSLGGRVNTATLTTMSDHLSPQGAVRQWAISLADLPALDDDKLQLLLQLCNGSQATEGWSGAAGKTAISEYQNVFLAIRGRSPSTCFFPPKMKYVRVV